MDLKNFPMDIQTCTMQLESCEYYILLFLPHPSSPFPSSHFAAFDSSDTGMEF